MHNRWMVGCALAGLMWGTSCANRGTGPQGGPRDTIAPQVMKETPMNGAMNYRGKSIEIQFDEYVQLADISKNIIISPPQQTQPNIKAFGKRVEVEFLDPLLDSTTYTIDFGAAICDYNEKTPLKDYSFAFSTGPAIDSLRISGIVVDAQTLNSMPNMMVGIHSNAEDSALSSLPFTRITRTDHEGYFTIRNIHEGSYRLYALDDISRDYRYQPGEGLAFCDSIIHPTMDVTFVSDTIWRDSLAVDSLSGDTLAIHLPDSVETGLLYTFEPYDMVLWYFKEDKQRLYLQSTKRTEPHCFTLLFSAPQDSMPGWHALPPYTGDSVVADSTWTDWSSYCLVQTNAGHDTLTFWLTDSLAIGQDTLCFEMTYQVTDSIYQKVLRTDTLRAIYREPRMSDKAREAKMREKQNRKLDFRTNTSNKFEIYDTLSIHCAYPIDSVFEDKIHLMVKEDTLWIPVKGKLVSRDSLHMHWQWVARLEPTKSYELRVDSAALVDVYGKCNEAYKGSLTLKSKEDYSSILIKLVHFDPRLRIQLLNGKDEVVKEVSAEENGAKLEYLTPNEYYMRLYLDENEDRKWTTGDWALHRMPEPVYYFPKKLKLRANWDFEEVFDHLAIPQLDAKPMSLRPKTNAKK